MSDTRPVLLSYVVPCDAWSTIAAVAAALDAQAIAGEIELVLVGPSEEALRPPVGSVANLGAVSIVEAPLLPVEEARVAGVRAARAPTVVLGETHAYPAAGWAAALVEAVSGGATAAAPRIVHAGRIGALSWAALAMDYGRWLRPGRETIAVAPSYNAAWNRETLLGVAGDELAPLLQPGRELSDLMSSRGHRLERCGGAEVAHLNIDRPRHWLAERYLGGRLLAARRARSWPRRRRALYAAASPLIALVVTRRAIAAVRGIDRPLAGLAALGAGVAVWAAGEAVGYVAGAGAADAAMLEYELHKTRYARQAP